MLELQGRRPLRGARDRELVDHYRWKVGWLQMEGMQAVRVFKAVIRIQKTLRGHFARNKLNKSKEDGLGAIEMAVRNAVKLGINEMERKIVPAAGSAGGSNDNTQLLLTITKQLSDLSVRLSAIESNTSGAAAAAPAPPPLPGKAAAAAEPAPPPLPDK